MADPGDEVPGAEGRSRSPPPRAGKGQQVDVLATTALSCGACGWGDGFAHIWENRWTPHPSQSRLSPEQLRSSRASAAGAPDPQLAGIAILLCILSPLSFARPQMQLPRRRAGGLLGPLANKLPRFCDSPRPTSSVSLLTPFHFAGAALHHFLSMKKATVWQHVLPRRGSPTLAADACLTPLPAAFLDQPPCSHAISVLP